SLWIFVMDIRSVFIFSTFILIPVLGQVVDNYCTDESNRSIHTKDTDNYSFDSFPKQNVSNPYVLDFDLASIYRPDLEYGLRYGNNLTAPPFFKKYAFESLDCPCQIDRLCTGINASYTCYCPIGWQGKKCSKGSTKDPTILRAVVGSLTGVLVVIALSDCLCLYTEDSKNETKEDA
ncbi:hypothetical protein ACJMK2_022985, partial [Sinanodonta woodiana]